jgi:hypothetical protein
MDGCPSHSTFGISLARENADLFEVVKVINVSNNIKKLTDIMLVKSKLETVDQGISLPFIY